VNSQGGNPKSIIIENTEKILKQKHIMKEQLVKISETIYLIFLPADVHNFNVQAEHLIYREGKLKLWKYFKIGFDFKIHGTCTLPMFDFDFEPIMGKEELTALIQKAIQDEGMFVVDPYGENKPQELVDYTGRKDGIIANSLELEQWKSSESKTVKKLLIIEKL